MKKKIPTPTLLATLLLSAGMSHADLIIYEPFDYELGNLQGKTANPGTGLTGTYSDTGSSPPDFEVTGTSLSYGSHPTSGGSASYVDSVGSGTGNVSHAVSTLTTGSGSLAGAGLLADGAVLWFSVLQRTTNNTAHDGFAFALATDPLTNNTNFTATGAQGVGFAISSAGNLTARVSTGPSTHTNGANIDRFSLAETILIVGKITWGDSSDTVLDMYLPDTSMNLGSVVSTASASVDQSAFDTLSFHTRRQGSADPTLITNVGLDEIRFGSTLGDVMVVPEPSSALLGGLGLLALLRRRRQVPGQDALTPPG